MATEKAYIRNLKYYEYFALFSLVARSLTEIGARWGDPDLTAQLQGQWSDDHPAHYANWRKLTKACVDHILTTFKKASRGYAKHEGEEMTYANYFKNQSYVARLLKSKLDGEIKKYARNVLKT